LYGVQLTSPSSGNIWTLTIELNYAMCKPGTSGCSLSGTIIPGSVIPPGQWSDGSYNSISDFLINWNNQDYAVVLAPHIQAGSSVASYVAGNLYQAPNTQFDEVYSGIPNDFGAPGVLTGSPERDLPVWIAAGGALLGAGTVSVALGGNGTPAMYTITDQFSAPDGFLATGDFTAIASTYLARMGLEPAPAASLGGIWVGYPSREHLFWWPPPWFCFGLDVVSSGNADYCNAQGSAFQRPSASSWRALKIFLVLERFGDS